MPPARSATYRDYFENALRNWDGILPLGNFWEIGGPFPLYHEFGYTAFLSACAPIPSTSARSGGADACLPASVPGSW